MKIVVGVEVGRELVKALRSARRRTWLATPFVSCSIIENLPPNVDGKIVTSPDSDLAKGLCTPPPNYSVKILQNLHAKLYIVDDRAWVGSPNLTESGLFHNIELLIEVDDRDELFHQLLNVFDALWKLATEPLFPRASQRIGGIRMSEPIIVLGKYRVLRDRLYTKTHEWIKIEGNVGIVGITDYAQSKLKNIVGVELPEVGKEVSKGGRLAVVESIKSVEDVYAPVTMRITEVNTRLENEPELVNKDPYGEGWIAKGEVVRREELDDLLTPEKYAELIESEEK